MTAGTRKAATLLASLPGPLASRLLEHLTPTQAAAVKKLAESSTPTAEMDRKRTLDEFFQLLAESTRTRSSGQSHRVDNAGPSVPPFHFLAPLPPSAILRLLKDELPQPQAAVIAQLPGPLSAEILALMTEERRCQVIRRLGALGVVSEVALADLADMMASILKRRMPVQADATARSGDILDQILASSSGTVHQMLAESIREYRGTVDRNADETKSSPGCP